VCGELRTLRLVFRGDVRITFMHFRIVHSDGLVLMLRGFEGPHLSLDCTFTKAYPEIVSCSTEFDELGSSKE
jgi:hypothetical protein